MIVPMLIGTIAGAVALHKKFVSSTDSSRIPAVLHEPDPRASNGDIPIAFLNGKASKIPARDIEKRIVVTCCEMVILAKESDAVSLLSETASQHPAVTRGVAKYPDGSVRGISLVSNPAHKHYNRHEALLGKDLAAIFPRDIQAKLTGMAARGSILERAKLIKEIRASEAVDRNSRIYNIIKQLPPDVAGKELDRILSLYYLQQALVSKAGGADRIPRQSFLNILVHEAVHASHYKYINQLGHSPFGNNDIDDKEFFGYYGAIAYGENPWAALADLLTKGRRIYLNELLVGRTSILFNKNGKIGPQQNEVAERFFHRLYISLHKEMGIKDPLKVLSKSSDELISTAKKLLDRFSMKYFGKNFGEVVPIADLENIKRQGTAYFDNEYKK